MKTIQQLRKWLKDKNNSKANLAAFLGYRSSNAVDQWFTRGSVPRKVEDKVKRFIHGNS